MKIIKNTLFENKKLREDSEKVEVSGKEIVDAAKSNEPLNLNKASKDEIAADMLASDESNVDIAKDNPDAKFEISKELDDTIKKVEIFSDIIYNPYLTGASKPDQAAVALQRALEVALRKKREGDTSDYPDVLLYGLGGSGKSWAVDDFCDLHNIDLVKITPEQLSEVQVMGLPQPTELDDGTTLTKRSEMALWWSIVHKNKPTILFFDEVNRGLENNSVILYKILDKHSIPATRVNTKTGEVTTEIYMPSVLFCICAVNPSNKAYKGLVREQDPSFTSRFGAVLETKPTLPGWNRAYGGKLRKLRSKYISTQKRVVDPNSLYGKIIEDPNLKLKNLAELDGRIELTDWLFNELSKLNPPFEFGDADDYADARRAQSTEGKFINPLNGRSLSKVIDMSDGTKADLINVIRNYSGFNKKDQDTLVNALNYYQDKNTTGNAGFANSGNQNARPNKSASAAKAGIDSILAGMTPAE